jgi:hypothetical protein
MPDPLLYAGIDPTQMSMNELGALVDSYDGMRSRKTALTREIDELSTEIARARKLIIAALEFQGVTSIGGTMARCAIVHKTVPQVVAWDELYQHIMRTGEFDLLHRRVGEAAVKARWESGVDVPGISAVDVNDLSVTRVR